MTKKKLGVQFKRHDIKAPPKDALKDLVNLYKAAEDEASYVDSEKKFFHEETDPLRKIIEKKRAHKKRVVFISILISLFILAGTAFAGFLYFSGHRTFKNETLELTIVGPEKAKLGEPIEYQIKYVNTGDVGLEEAKMNIQLPHGFILDKSDPALVNRQININTIKINSTGIITLSGRFIDNLEHEQKMVATLYFIPSNFNSEFSSETSLNTLLELPKVEFNINYPASVTLGQKFNLKIESKNESEYLFEKTKLEVTYPAAFQFLSATPKPIDVNTVWPIEKIMPNSTEKEIQIAGQFAPELIFQNEAERERPFEIQLLALGVNEQYYVIAEKEIMIKISEQPLQAYLIVNGSTDNKNVSLGKILTYSLVIKNTGAESFSDLKAKVIIKSAPIDIVDWEKIVDNNFGQIESGENGKVIVWTGTDIPKLETLKTKEDLTINFSVPLKSLEQLKSVNAEDLNDTNIESISEIYISDGSETPPPPVKSNPITISLNSNINLETRALYYYTDGTPLGTGPFPPEVGKPTQLHVFWDITNDLHEMQNIEVNSTLPKYITLIGSPNVSVGQFNFDEETNNISWKINSLPKTLKEAHCSFTIEFTPTDKQKGKFLQLTGNTTLTAKDAMTNETIIKTKNIVTTALEQDEFVTGEGLVK